jgi:hypothetical protein
MITKEFWHKPTGIPVSEATMIELVRIGAYPSNEFEEAVNLSESKVLADHEPVVGRSMSVVSGTVEVPPRNPSATP